MWTCQSLNVWNVWFVIDTSLWCISECFSSSWRGLGLVLMHVRTLWWRFLVLCLMYFANSPDALVWLISLDSALCALVFHLPTFVESLCVLVFELCPNVFWVILVFPRFSSWFQQVLVVFWNYFDPISHEALHPQPGTPIPHIASKS